MQERIFAVGTSQEDKVEVSDMSVKRSNACTYCIEAFQCDYDHCMLSDEEYEQLEQDAALCELLCPCEEE